LIFQPGNEIYHAMINNQLPGNLRIIPYDVLLQRFEDRYPPAVYFLVPESSGIPEHKLRLRAKALTLSVDDVQKMLQERDFYDRIWYWSGKGLRHEYERIARVGATLVIDHTTGLSWQQSGSSNYLNYTEAEKYIRDLNNNRFAGHNDWRLPSLEEAVCLIEPKKHGDLFIDPIFDRRQLWIWTADKISISSASSLHFFKQLWIWTDKNRTTSAWAVDFFNGTYIIIHRGLSHFVRAVR
jgi:hypothetical protein